MSECKHECIVLKRICIFILGVVIGFGGGYKYHQTKVQHRVHDRLMKQAEKPILLEKRKKRQKLREQKEKTETPRVRVPR